MNTSAKESIVGIAGKPRSGKDSLAEVFIESGYFGFTVGDFVRGYARQRHGDKPDPISIENMTETANWLRATKGPDFALKEALRQYREVKDKYKGLVIYSVRVPVEVDFILQHSGELIWVEASDDVRFERNVLAKREGEPDISKEEFLRQEALQWQPQPDLPAEVQMNIEYVKSKATTVFTNELGFEEFREKAKKLVESLISFS